MGLVPTCHQARSKTASCEQVAGDEVAGVVFHPANGIDEAGVAQAQATLRRPTLCHGMIAQGR